ncbi:MAG: metallophosphoesterase, partial [Coprobacillus cateniformis]
HHISILLDSQVNIQDEMTIIGRQDRSLGEREDTQQLIKNVNHENFILMLDHQPVDLQKNNELHVDLQLSGHTHGGQMFPVGLITSVLGFGEMNYGYQAMSNMTVIVSSGIAGWGYPLRTGSHSEYVIVDIVKE